MPLNLKTFQQKVATNDEAAMPMHRVRRLADDLWRITESANRSGYSLEELADIACEENDATK